MSLKNLVDRIESDFNSRAEAERAVKAVTGGIVSAVRAGEKITINDFGRFEQKRREERNGRNPATGETIKIAAKTVFAMKSSVTF